LRLNFGDDNKASAIRLTGSRKKEIKNILNTAYY
jgi:hypothetical protein